MLRRPRLQSRTSVCHRDSCTTRLASLAHGPRGVSDVEEAAVKAHIEALALEQARGDLGVVTSRANTGNTLSVQWSLPG
jgi:hypothetical protein